LQEEEKKIEIDMSKLNLTAENGELTLALVSKNQEILSTSHKINIEEPIQEEQIPLSANETLLNLTNETTLNLTNETSFTLTNETLFNLTNETTLNLTNETSFTLTNETLFNLTNETTLNLTNETSFYFNK
jgi:hypothetical protein